MKSQLSNQKMLLTLLFFLLQIFCGFNGQQKSTINVANYGVSVVNNNQETDGEKYQRWLKIEELFYYAIENKVNLFFPKGIYDVGTRNFPFRKPDINKDHNLLDCGNIMIFGEKGSLFKTSSVYGADVLQLNKVKNIKFRDLEITASLQKYEKSGSNGISITNGFDNIVLENIHIYDLPGVDKQYGIDGGKGLTIQSDPNSKSLMGSIIAKNITVDNSAYGFRMDTRHVSDILENYRTIRIDIDMKVNKAFQGFSIEFGDADKDVNLSAKLKIKANIVLTNCQQYVRFARLVGGTYYFKLFRSQNYNQILRDRHQKFWTSEHDGVFGLLSNYTKNSTIFIDGDVGVVDTKVWIGAVGNIVEPFNLRNSTEYNKFYFDIGGISTDTDLRLISVAGNSLNNNIIKITKRTANKIPLEFINNSNTLIKLD